MFVKSNYCIEIKSEIPYKIYSTKTGKLVIVSPEEYETIFIKEDYTECSELVTMLINAEILISPEINQAEELEKTRKDTIDLYNSKYTSNYVITPTMACNARCSYCFEKNTHQKNMSKKMAESVVAFIISNYVDKPITIHWFGGEPLLANDIIDTISLGLINAGIKFVSRITTNGLLLNENIVKKAMSFWNVQYVQITLDDIGDNYNRIKNFKTSIINPFEVVIENIRNAIEAGMIVRIRNNYDPEAFEKAQEIIDYSWKEFNMNPNIIYHMHALFSDDVKSITKKFSNEKTHPFLAVLEYEELIASLYPSSAKRINQGDARFTAWCDPRVYIEGNEAINILCKHMLYPVPVHCFGICDNSIAIDSLGEIYVCHSLLGKGKSYSSGNVMEGIMKNDTYMYYQDFSITNKQCVNCNLLPLCQGGCKFKRTMYKTNQYCIPIKGCSEEALLHALDEIQRKFGSLSIIM